MVRANLQELRAGLGVRASDAENQALDLDGTLLPPKIRAVIDSRLTQLSTLARKVADLAAVIGRDFTFTVLAHASDSSEDELAQGLDELLRWHMVREKSAEAYDFSHDKLREAVYARLSAIRRRVLHRHIAEALEIVHGAARNQVSSQIAAHYEQAGLAEQALPAYLHAAQAALRVYAHADAIELFQKALALLATLPQSEDRDRQELAILMRLGSVLAGVRGFSGRQVDEVYLRAQHLTQKLGEPPNPAILRALGIFYIVRRAFVQSQAYGAQILALAHQMGEQADPVLEVEAHYVLGANVFWLGEFVRAREHLEAAVARYDQSRHEIHTTFYVQDPGAVCLSRLAFALWYLGYPDQAQQRCAEALALARQFNHPFTLAYVLTFAAWLNSDSRNRTATAFAAEVVAYSRQHGLQYWTPIGLVIEGHLLAEQGEIEAGIAEMRTGMIADQAARFDLYHPYTLAMLAQAYAQAGAPDQGLSMLEEALASVDECGDHWYEAELLRLKGELLAGMGTDEDTVEGYFQQALTLARRQQAKSLELRTALSLARLWVRQGKRKEAHTLLSNVYAWFSEGFDTSDLKQAKACLDQLA